MVIVRLGGPRLLPDPPGGIFWGVKRSDHCDNIFVKPLLDLKVSFIVYPMESV